MKKFTFLMIAILVASMSFAQQQVQLRNRTAIVPSHKSLQTSLQAKATRTVIFTEDFESGMPAGWATVDSDGDGFNWESHINTGSGNFEAHSGDGILTSASYDNDNGVALTPDNWVITPAIELPATTDPIMLTFYVCGQDASYAGEHYGVYISTGDNQTDLTSFVCLGQETIDANGGSGLTRESGAYGEKNVDLTSYANQTVYIAFRHFNCTDMFYLNLDDVSVNTLSACTTPMNPNTTDITYTSATLNWTGFSDSYNVRYRALTATIYENFENGIPATWTTIDADADGNNWLAVSEIPTVYTSYSQVPAWAHEGNDAATSPSYANGAGAFSSDQWLISPQVDLGGLLMFYATSAYADEYEVLLSTTGTDISDFTTTLKTMTAASTTWDEISIDLSSYAGQQGYIAIHHVFEDGYFLIIDDFGIYTIGEWVEANATEATLALNNLTDGTTYEWQVRGVCEGDETTDWSASVSFTTPILVSIDAAEEIANIAVYPNPTKDMVTVANAEGKNIVIVNSLGQVVANIENAAANQTIDVANFANGTYFVKVDAEVVKLNVVK